MSKKKSKFYALADIHRMLNVPAYRIQYLFTKGILKREDYPRAGKTPLFTIHDVEVISSLLGQINTFRWSDKKKAVNQ